MDPPTSKPTADSLENPAMHPQEIEGKSPFGKIKKPLPAPRKVLSNIPLPSEVIKEEPPIKKQLWGSGKPIGKLKLPTGLIINPIALLPGSKPPVAKSTPNEQASGCGLISQAIKFAGSSSEGKDPMVAASAGYPSSSLDESRALLYSAVKGRAKIQAKRKPQSRKARHEAIRKSALLDNLTVETMPPKEDISSEGPSTGAVQRNTAVTGGFFLGTASSKIIKSSFARPKRMVEALNDEDGEVFTRPCKAALLVATEAAQASQARDDLPDAKSSSKKAEDTDNDPWTLLQH